MNMWLGARVKALRENMGISQNQLAKLSSISQSTLSALEANQVKELKAEALKRLAEVLGVTMDYLVGKTDTIAPNEIIRCDTKAQHILQMYKKLSKKNKEKLETFVRFLDEEEKAEVEVAR
jgi:transcriptional regulator with XRE-family HTH domain